MQFFTQFLLKQRSLNCLKSLDAFLYEAIFVKFDLELFFSLNPCYNLYFSQIRTIASVITKKTTLQFFALILSPLLPKLHHKLGLFDKAQIHSSNTC